MAGFLLLVAGFDWFWQRQRFMARHRMSKEELKEDYKQTEGDPHVKAKQRQIRIQRSRRRMMQAVPNATVVVMNPTHYAVALKYDTLTMDAPRVIAKGKDLLAQRIKQIAAEHNIPMVENVPLAQALYKSCPVGREIPAFLYQAVAEVLAFVFRVRRGMQRAVA